MSLRSVFCIASSRGRADRIVNDLKTAAFSPTEISVLFLDHRAGATRGAGPAASVAAQSPEEIRGVLRWIEGIGSLLIPGIGPLIVAGPIASALRGAKISGVAGRLIAFGMPNVEASRYEGRIKGGQILAAVHTTNSDQGDRAREILTAAGAEDIFTIVEVTTPNLP